MLYTTKIENGDEVRSPGSAGYELVSGKDKIRQDVRMVFSTNIRDTTGLGAQLDDAVGSDAENPAAVFSPTPFMFEFQMRVKSALDRLKRMQRKFHYSYRVPSELIYDFTAVQLWSIRDDPRNYRWQVGITTVDGKSGFYMRGRTRS